MLADSPIKAAMTLHGQVSAAELQFLMKSHTDCGQLLFGSSPSEPIGIPLLDLMAALASLRKLHPLLKDARMAIVIDNDASRHALARGDSRVTMARWIAQA